MATKAQLEQLVRELQAEIKTRDAEIAEQIIQTARLQSQLTAAVTESPQYKAMVSALEAEQRRREQISGSTRVQELEERLEKEREARRRAEAALIAQKQAVNQLREELREAQEQAHARAAAVRIAEAMDPVQPRIGRPAKITETDRQRVRELRQQGQSVRQIAKACGLSVGSVSGILRA